MTAGDVVYTKDISSGRIHKQYRTDGPGLASTEGCNLDDAGGSIEITEATAFASPASLKCLRCFPVETGTPDTDAHTEAE